MENINVHSDKATWTPNTINTQSFTPKQIIIKMFKVKDKGNFLKKQERNDASHVGDPNKNNS